jgi:acyl-coenzyme A synthetase/AMP-(fatty) acid ligase
MNDRLQADIGQIFEQLAYSQPAAPALHVPRHASLTYADLAKQIGHLRKRLSEWGFGRGDVIAEMIPLRPEMAVALAALPAASTFAPLGPAFSEDLYAELLTRLRAKAVIVPAELEHPGARRRKALRPRRDRGRTNAWVGGVRRKGEGLLRFTACVCPPFAYC